MITTPYQNSDNKELLQKIWSYKQLSFPPNLIELIGYHDKFQQKICLIKDMLKVNSVETNYKFRCEKTKKISLQQSTCIANSHIIQSAQDRKEATYTSQVTSKQYHSVIHGPNNT